MDRPAKNHPLEENLVQKDARREEPRKHSWFGRRISTNKVTKEPESGVQPRRSEAIGDRPPLVPQFSKSYFEPQSPRQNHHVIQLQNTEVSTQQLQKRTINSDGGSVRSNMKKLSVEDDRTTHQTPSPPAGSVTTKRAAEDLQGQISEDIARPFKRPGQQNTVAHLKKPNDHERTTDAEDQLNVISSSQPGLINVSQASRDQNLDSLSTTSNLPKSSNDEVEPEIKMLLQPETRPITQDQLVNEVKGIYAGLVMVEKKCVEIDQQQSKTTNKLSDEQWQALIALHRTLLYEHHDFFLASQHPSSSPALRRLATKYAMPARMWRHGIHSFLELLRHRLPDSLDHMLAFVYLAYSMMALLMESVPSFVETWIECLGDLARYRMAIEEIDLRDREIWSGCAKMWYEKAADKSPNVGRIQHHLAVLARPNIVQQLFYYSKALVSVIPFQNARESVMLLFNPFLQEGETVSQKYPQVEAAFVTFHGVLLTHGSLRLFWSNIHIFFSGLDAHIGRIGPRFRVQGPEMAFHKDAELRKPNPQEETTKILDQLPATVQVFRDSGALLRDYWAAVEGDPEDCTKAETHTVMETTTTSNFSGSQDASASAVQMLGRSAAIVSQRIGDKNVVPFMHVLLAYLWSLAHVPGALSYIQTYIPWKSITVFLNTLGRSGVDESHVVGDEFPQQLSGTGTQLPEDFPMRGLIWAQHYFPANFFEDQVVDEDERTLDLPSHAAPRAERCLWLGFQLASLDRWLVYDVETKKFSVTEYARSWGEPSRTHSIGSASHTLRVERDGDIPMVDARS